MHSIERVLLAWVLGAMLLGGLLIGGVTYLMTRDEFDEIYDAQLRHVAEALGSYRSGPLPAEADLDARYRFPPRVDVPDRSEITTVTWTHDGQLVYTSDSRVHLPFRSTEALTTLVVEGEEWIVYTDISPNGVAQAAQRAHARDEMAAEAMGKVFLPILGLALLLALLMVVALRRGLRPLDSAAREIAARSAASLDPVSSRDVPREIVPLVRALNGLLLRLADAMAAQRRFLADVAHGLRTPVTALQLQVQWLRRTTDGAGRPEASGPLEVRRAEAVDQLEAGVERARRLVEQLLHVARFGPDAPPPAHDRVDLGELAREVVAAASAKAEHRGIDLGVTGLAPDVPVPVWGEREQLTVLLNNLVENALRYTPAGGVVDVDVMAQGPGVGWRVIDDGPGIPAAEWSSVFDRFYRGEQATATARDGGGTGLGLAIVRAIAEHHGAQVSLHRPESGRGLEVRVRFERADAAAAAGSIPPRAAGPAAGDSAGPSG